MLTLKRLEMYAEKFLKDNYNLTLNVPLILNGRLKTTCGRFRYSLHRNGNTKAISIELNKFFVENNDVSVVIDVLAHELVHYALFMKGKPNSDGHPYFESELKRLKVVSQSTINEYTIRAKKRNINIYTCKVSSCNKEYQTIRALSNGGVNHRCTCGGKLNYNGKKLVSV